MRYTIKQLAELSGVTSRTLRWYDQLGLLIPDRQQENDYRVYDGASVNRLQEILLFRELGFPLAEVKRLLDDPAYDRRRAMESHLQTLMERRAKMDALISTVEKSLDEMQGGKVMTDQAKFEALKREKVAENDKKYGAEVRAKYGEQAAEEGNRAMMNMSKETFDRWEALGREIKSGLEDAVERGEHPSGTAARALAQKHLQWLQLAMGKCDSAMQAGLTQMYVEDERFRSHYDEHVLGCAEFLREAVAAGRE